MDDVPVKNANNQRLVVPGYSLEAGKGHGDNHVHVKPWLKRTDKFKHKLLQRLKAAPPRANLFEIAEKYRRQWFGSQGAWTKVPGYSDDVSRSITTTYVSDFIAGIPMGTRKLNKPKVASIASP